MPQQKEKTTAKALKIALIVTTYNWPEALRLSLGSIKRQSRLPDCVIVADDGSTADTAQLIAEARQTFPCPLVHVWQEDKGFRLAKIRNRAIAEAARRGMDYVIQIDGDIILHRQFVADHLADAAPHQLLCGARAYISERTSKQLLSQVRRGGLSFFARGVVNRLNALRSPLLSRLVRRNKRHLGCNMSYFVADALAVNGYDEDYEGWGAEDEDFARRLKRTGVHQQRIKFKAVCFHIYHPSHARAENYPLMESKLAQGQSRVARGVDQYL